MHVEHLEQRVIILVEKDGSASQGAEFHGSANVVDVGVSDDDLLHVEVVPLDDRNDVFDVIAGIDDHGFVSGLVSDDGAVTLQRTDRDDLVNHLAIFAQASGFHHTDETYSKRSAYIRLRLLVQTAGGSSNDVKNVLSYRSPD